MNPNPLSNLSPEDQYIYVINLEKQLNRTREELNDIKSHLREICEYKEEYLELFNNRVSKLEFQSHKYKDEETYERCVTSKKLFNMFMYILNGC